MAQTTHVEAVDAKRMKLNDSTSITTVATPWATQEYKRNVLILKDFFLEDAKWWLLWCLAENYPWVRFQNVRISCETYLEYGSIQHKTNAKNVLASSWSLVFHVNTLISPSKTSWHAASVANKTASNSMEKHLKPSMIHKIHDYVLRLMQVAYYIFQGNQLQ